MPKKQLPPGWPDPYTLLRDPEYEEHYPKLFLRGIYGVMQRAPGDIEAKYIAGFNIALFKLTMAERPRFYRDQIRDGILVMDSLTPHGKKLEAEVLGIRDLSPTSRRKHGKAMTRSKLKRDTFRKLKKLRIMIDMVRGTTSEEGMPSGASRLVTGG